MVSECLEKYVIWLFLVFHIAGHVGGLVIGFLEIGIGTFIPWRQHRSGV